MQGTVQNLETLTGWLAADIRRMEATWGSALPSSRSSSGSRAAPIEVEDNNKIVIREEREDTVVPRAGTPFIPRSGQVTTLIEVPDKAFLPADQSIDAMEDQFMIATGVLVHRRRRVAHWPPDEEEVKSSKVGEVRTGLEVIQDFAKEERMQAQADMDDAALFEASATLQVALIGDNPAPEFGEHPPDYEE